MASVNLNLIKSACVILIKLIKKINSQVQLGFIPYFYLTFFNSSLVIVKQNS